MMWGVFFHITQKKVILFIRWLKNTGGTSHKAWSTKTNKDQSKSTSLKSLSWVLQWGFFV